MVDSFWSIDNFDLRKFGKLVVCNMHIRFHEPSLFDGVYAYIPDGFRPAEDTGYVPATMASFSYSQGVCNFNADGRVRSICKIAEHNNIICHACWLTA